MVCMYPIYPDRISWNDRLNIKLFHKVCSKHELSKVILATTRWDICPPNVGERREKALQDNFWKDMLDANNANRLARMERLANDQSSAWRIVEQILTKFNNSQIDGVILDLHDQLVTRNKQLKETDAARELRKQLQEVQQLKLSFSGRVMNFFKK